MVKPRDSTSSSCPNCATYMSRVEDLEEINKSHHALNARLRKAISALHYWIGTLEKEFRPPETGEYEYR